MFSIRVLFKPKQSDTKTDCQKVPLNMILYSSCSINGCVHGLEVRLWRDKTENRSASCIATSGIIQIKTIQERVLHDETSFTITPRFFLVLLHFEEERTVGPVVKRVCVFSMESEHV